MYVDLHSVARTKIREEKKNDPKTKKGPKCVYMYIAAHAHTEVKTQRETRREDASLQVVTIGPIGRSR